MDVTTLGIIVQLASDFGPFLFAILFILFVPRTAHKWYEAACVREKPPIDEKEEKMLRFYFKCSVYSGIAAMVLSCIWWVYNHSREQHLYQVTITGLQNNEEIQSKYFSRYGFQQPIPGSVQKHDVYLLVVQNQPFQIGDKFTIDYYKSPSNTGGPGGVLTVNPLVFTYKGHDEDTFKIESAPGKPPNLRLVQFHKMTVRNTSVAGINVPLLRKIVLANSRFVDGKRQ